MSWLVPVILLVLLGAGAALAYVMGAAAVLTFAATDNLRYLAIIPQRIFSQIDVFALMAMPLFILTGEVMNRSGITTALIDISMALVGRLKGGLGHVNVMTSVFFAGISGSAVADAAALSNMLVPEMKARGYSATYAGAITAASSVIGPIIPPSIILIFYGALTGTSVAGLFVGGILPGLLLAGALFAMNGAIAHLKDHPGGRGVEVPPLVPSALRAAPAMMLPFIIVAGIVVGWFTPTEAAGIAVLFALAISPFYGGISRDMIWQSLQRTAMLTGSIFILLSAVAALGYVAGLEQVPQGLAALVTDAGLGPLEYLLALNLVLLVAGMIMDVPVALALLVPLLAPVAVAQGADPLHLGIVICFNLCIGLISPPLGGCLLIVSTVTRLNYWRLAAAILPFFVVEILVLLLLVTVPEITLFLPRLFGF
ncbi:TRAP transporter large permease [Marinibaculum pumilum]|uniref:TRAP transporter large permease protein n=1 Tax=Marinibaculum pumilum TaxID=1766165 RepID=A0ABV7L2I0_9PROT